MTWSKQYGCTFGAASGGPNNVTPMHLAVLLTGGPAMAAKLTGLSLPQAFVCMCRTCCVGFIAKDGYSGSQIGPCLAATCTVTDF